MHPALFLEEILREIFLYRYYQRFRFLYGDHPLADLASLARTCRVFKEPALDVLWMNLHDLSRLVRCLPGTCHMKDLGGGKHIYMLKRDLEQEEMNTVKSYARRVRFLVLSSEEGVRAHLDPGTLRHLCCTSQTEPLFTNLRLLSLVVVDDVALLARHVAVPSLRNVTLFISTSTPSSCEEFLRSLSSSSLDIQAMLVRFRAGWSLSAFSDIMNRHIQHWTHLQSMTCHEMNVDIDTFLHLSRVPSLTTVAFMLGSGLIDQIESSNQVFTFPALHSISLSINSTVPCDKFFSHLQLPALEAIFMYYIGILPSKDMIRSFAIALQTVCNHELVKNITLDGSASWSAEPTTLVLDDILPFTAFNLTHLRIELDWIVDLKDADLLRLASDCPRIEFLHINNEFGWRSAGITPACLVEVLRRCPSLRIFCIVLDTRESQTLIAPGGPLDHSPSGPFWAASVADSIIEAESVPALAAFFADFIPSDGVFFFSSWDSNLVQRLHQDWHVYQERWNDVNKMLKEIVLERSMGLDRPQTESS